MCRQTPLRNSFRPAWRRLFSRGGGEIIRIRITVSPFVNTFFEERLQDLFNLAARLEKAFHAAGIEYRVVGGLAAYLYVEQAEADAGRLTKDIDIVVRREDLPRIQEAAETAGLELAGVDMLVQKGQPSARRAIHMVFAGEKVRPEYSEPVAELGEDKRIQGIPVIPLAGLVKMKLTSFRLKDQTHLKDLEEQGLITPEIEAGLPPLLRERLAHVRAQE